MMMGQVIFVLLRKDCYCIDGTGAAAPGHVFFSGHIILLFLLGGLDSLLMRKTCLLPFMLGEGFFVTEMDNTLYLLCQIVFFLY